MFLYLVLLKWKALHSMIITVSDIEMTMTIEGQTDGTIELICTFSPAVSTHHDSALCCPTTPAHHSMIPVVCHVDVACRIDPHSVRMRQLRQILPLASSTSHDNPFFGALHPFHHTMIVAVRDVDSVFSIHTDVEGEVELIQGSTLPISTSHDDAIRLSSAIASHFMLPDVSDVEWSLVIHRQSPTVDVVDDRFSTSGALSTWPACYSTILSIADDETVGFFVEDHICRFIQLIRSLSFSVATGQHCATRRTSLPFHDAVIQVVSNDHRVLVIHAETARVVELVCLTPFAVSSSDSDPILSPPSVGCNERKREGWENDGSIPEKFARGSKARQVYRKSPFKRDPQEDPASCRFMVLFNN